VLGLPVSWLIPPELLNEHTKRLELLAAGEGNRGFETVRLGSGGRRIPVWISATAIRDAEGSIVAITEVHQASDAQPKSEPDPEDTRTSLDVALRESEEKFSQAFLFAPVLMAITTLEDGIFLDVNREFTAVTGFSREELLGRSSIAFGFFSTETRRGC
jgi:PAS domain-containing protein